MHSSNKEILDTYRERRSIQEQHTAEAERFVKDTLKNKFEVVDINSRTKTARSLQEKLRRKQSELQRSYNSIDDIHDLSGVRVVLFNVDDVEQAARALSDALVRPSLDAKGKGLAPNQFGYSSVHVVGLLPHVEDPARSGYKFEVQVRSVLQHAWAMLSHRTLYKSEGSSPDSVKREIGQVASLLEVSDNIWKRILAEKERYRLAVKDGITAKKNYKHPINADTVAIFLDSKAVKGFMDDLCRMYGIKVNLNEGDHEDCRDLFFAAASMQHATELAQLVDLIRSDDHRTRAIVTWCRNQYPDDWCPYILLALLMWGALGEPPSFEQVRRTVVDLLGWSPDKATTIYVAVTSAQNGMSI